MFLKSEEAVMAIRLMALLFCGVVLTFTLAAQAAPLRTVKSPFAPFRWVATGPLISPQPDSRHKIVALKDPTVVFVDNVWHVYATTADTRGMWNMVYCASADWESAGRAPQYFMDNNRALTGYHCAPQVFYFRPQKKWYLVYQSQPPSYSTADNIGRPENWSAPKYFYQKQPAGVPSLWIDYWVICDDKNAYLFSSGDDGKFYRCQTTVADFPAGFGEITVVMEYPRFDLFEGACVYAIKGTKQYLAIIECIGKTGLRYYKAFLADRLDGAWTPLADSEETPFAGIANVVFPEGVEPWTRHVSHGELLRDGYDETMTIDPKNLRFLYQGMGLGQGEMNNLDYSQLPWRLGILKQAAPKKK
jgi:hypothetical protein